MVLALNPSVLLPAAQSFVATYDQEYAYFDSRTVLPIPRLFERTRLCGRLIHFVLSFPGMMRGRGYEAFQKAGTS
jgi:hypothetical protein